MQADDKPKRIRHKRHSLLFRFRMARRIRGVIQGRAAVKDFERFERGLSGDLPKGGGQGIILAACNDYYYWHFAITLVLSMELQGDRQSAHLHLCEPAPDTLAHIARLGAGLSHVQLSWTVDNCNLADGLAHRTVYYAASRFLLAPLILERTRSPLLCIDVDGIAVRPVWPAYETMRQAADLLLIRRPEEEKPTMKILASAVGINPTPKATRFADSLGHSLAAIFALKPGYHIDQIAIHYLLRALSPEATPTIADMPKAFWDHDFGQDSAIWTAKGWSRKESDAFQVAKQAVDRKFPDFASELQA